MFTRKQLDLQIENMNAKLPANVKLVPEGRNNYTAIDLYIKGDGNTMVCNRCIGSGTPRQCWNAALEFYYYTSTGAKEGTSERR